MASNKWLGIAPPRVAVKAFQPSNISPGSVWVLRVGGQNFTYTYSASIDPVGLTDQERAETVCEGLSDAYAGGGLGGGSSQTIESLAAELVSGIWSLVARGVSTGAPIDVELSASEASSSSVKVIELQAGRTAQNEQQIIKWPRTPTAGTLSLRYQDDSTSVAYNAAAATVQTALEALTSIGAGNVAVSGSHTAGYTVEFQGSLAGTDADLLVAFSTDSTGTATAAYEVTVRGGITRTTYAMTALDDDSEHLMRFLFGGVESHYFTGAASAAQVQAALESIPALSGNVDVQAASDGSLSIAMTSTLIGTDVETLTVETVAGETTPTLTETAGATEPVQTVLRITVHNLPRFASGNITLNYDGVSTAAMPIATVVIGDINTELTTAAIPWTATLLTKATNQPLVIELTSDEPYDTGIVTLTHTLVGCDAIEVRTVQSSRAARNGLQQVALHSDPDGGTFTLTYGANTTAGLAYNASAATIQTALEALASIGAGNAAVDGNDGGPWLVSFQGTLAAQAVSLITGSGASLTITDSVTATEVEITSPTGPNWWTNAANWSLGNVPASTDTAVFESGSVPCLYGIANVPAIAGLDVYRGYSGGMIGLPETREDGSTETLPQELSLSDLGTKIAIRIGLGDDGDGPTVVRINTQAQEADVSVVYSSTAGTQTLYTIGLAGDLASVQVNSASVLFSGRTGLVTTIDELRFSPGTDSNAVLEWGESATVAYVESNGGTLRCGSVPVAMFVSGGAVSIRGVGNINQLSVRNAILRYMAAGNLGLQGEITTLSADINDRLIITSVAHGLASGDLVFVRGIFGFADKYFIIEVLTADTFALVGSDATYIAEGTIDEAFFDDFFGGGGDVPTSSSDGAKWGLADAMRIGVGGELDFSELGLIRFAPAPIVLQSEDAVIRDPLITIADLRWHSYPGFMDADFGSQGVFKREQSVAVSYNSTSFVNGGGGVVGG